MPRRETRAEGRPLLVALRTITWVQWAQFWSGYVAIKRCSSRTRLLILTAIHFRWLAWSCDAIDFFSVSLSVSRLATQFDRDTSDIVRPIRLLKHAFDAREQCLTWVSFPCMQTTAITLTLLFRSVGAVSCFSFVSRASPVFAQRATPKISDRTRYFELP